MEKGVKQTMSGLMGKKQILFIKTMNSTFIKRDEEILKKYYHISSHFFKPGNAFRMFLSQMQMIFWSIRNILKADLLYIWFADYHSLVPVLMANIFDKKSVILLGGMDAVKIPEVNQGVYLRHFRGLCAKLSVRYCTHIITCDASLIETINTYAKDTPIKAGLKYLVEYFRTPFTVIPFGFDAKKWKASEKKHEKIVLTVAIISNINKLKLKGIDLLIEVARKLPEYKFKIIGAAQFGEKYLTQNKPGNMIVLGPVKNEELVPHYQQAKVYAQLSWSEGLPNVLCEAMLCGCIPVGSNVNGIPNAIGDAGFIVKKRNIEEVTTVLKQALEADSDLGRSARKRMQKLFSLEGRENKLIATIESLF